MTSTGTLRIPATLSDPATLYARAATIADPHRAFHVRSMLPTPSALCMRCAR